MYPSTNGKTSSPSTSHYLNAYRYTWITLALPDLPQLLRGPFTSPRQSTGTTTDYPHCHNSSLHSLHFSIVSNICETSSLVQNLLAFLPPMQRPSGMRVHHTNWVSRTIVQWVRCSRHCFDSNVNVRTEFLLGMPWYSEWNACNRLY